MSPSIEPTRAARRVLVLVLLALGACHAPAGPVFRQEGPRAVDILDGTVSPADGRRGEGRASADARREALIRAQLDARGERNRGLIPYTRDALDEIEQLFPRLENPEIALYVTPHQGGGPNTQAPVPGYTTAFDLYRERPYALPSEIAPTYLPPERFRSPRAPDRARETAQEPVLSGTGVPLVAGVERARP